jgi:hypothetical protein
VLDDFASEEDDEDEDDDASEEDDEVDAPDLDAAGELLDEEPRLSLR